MLLEILLYTYFNTSVKKWPTKLSFIEKIISLSAYLDCFVPTCRYNNWVSCIWWESDGWYPFRMTFILRKEKDNKIYKPIDNQITKSTWINLQCRLKCIYHKKLIFLQNSAQSYQRLHIYIIINIKNCFRVQGSSPSHSRVTARVKASLVNLLLRC